MSFGLGAKKRLADGQTTDMTKSRHDNKTTEMEEEK
jgi:hypothetical protein